MDQPKVGALFAGYGGLEMGVSQVLDTRPAWFSEFDPAPSRILAQRFPGVPNLGDVTKVDWAAVEPVDIITGGYPCQPFSHAGNRKGTQDSRHLWPYVTDAVSVLRPMMCVFENVQGHLSLGFDQVVRDLHQLGYDVYWTLMSAASVGAPHRRNRLFILAVDRSAHDTAVRSWPDRWGGVYRYSGGRRFVSCAPEGCDDGQGAAGAGGVEHSLRGSGSTRPGRHGDESLNSGVGGDRDGGREGRDRASSDAAGEGRGCGHRDGVRQDAPAAACVAEQGAPVGRGVDGAGRDVEGPHSGSESPRTRPGSAQAPEEHDSASRVPLGMVVGTGGRPIRSGGVQGEVTAEWRDDLGSRVRGLNLLPSPRTSDTNGAGAHGEDRRSTSGYGPALRDVATLLPTPTSTDHKASGASYAATDTHHTGTTLTDATVRQPERFGIYAQAIERWVPVMGRLAPEPTEPTGKGGAHRLSPRFVEWLMGLPDGWVTDTDTTRNEQLKALGNGVVPQQAAAALLHLLEIRAHALTM